jgi:hypothetical protein
VLPSLGEAATSAVTGDRFCPDFQILMNDDTRFYRFPPGGLFGVPSSGGVILQALASHKRKAANRTNAAAVRNRE